MKAYILVGLMTLAPALANAKTCYRVSSMEGAWSKTPETLCVDQVSSAPTVDITLKTGLPFKEQTVAVFHLDLLVRAKCIDCNKDVFGLLNPSNSSFNSLAIRFDGIRDVQTMKEEGVVYFGASKLFYESL
jgi:hypothetical protein